MRSIWKWLGIAGVLGVAAGGAAIARGIPCITTIAGGMAVARAITAARVGSPPVHSLQDLHRRGRERVAAL